MNAPVSAETKLYVHDCDKCTYLGQFHGMDLYHCTQGGKLPTVIARYGSDGPEYKSGFSARFDIELSEAYDRAFKAGLEVCT